MPSPGFVISERRVTIWIVFDSILPYSLYVLDVIKLHKPGVHQDQDQDVPEVQQDQDQDHVHQN